MRKRIRVCPIQRATPLLCGFFPCCVLVTKKFTQTLNRKREFQKKIPDNNFKTRTERERETHARKRTPGGGFFFYYYFFFRAFFFRWSRFLSSQKGARSSWRQQKQQVLFFVIREKFDFFASSKTNNSDDAKTTKKKRGFDVFFFARRRRKRNDGATTRPSDRELRAQTALSRRKRKSPAENLLERSRHVGVRYRLSTLTRRYFRTRD